MCFTLPKTPTAPTPLQSLNWDLSQLLGGVVKARRAFKGVIHEINGLHLVREAYYLYDPPESSFCCGLLKETDKEGISAECGDQWFDWNEYADPRSCYLIRALKEDHMSLLAKHRAEVYNLETSGAMGQWGDDQMKFVWKGENGVLCEEGDEDFWEDNESFTEWGTYYQA